MRALLVSVGTAGDVLPLIALGAELRRRGHEVAFAAAEPFGDSAARAGLDFTSLMPAADYREVFEHPDFWRPIKGAKLLFSAVCDLMRPAYDFVANRHVAEETVVIASSLAIGAKVARDKFNLPLVTVHLSPVMVQSRHEAPIVPGLMVPDWLPESAKWTLQMGSDKHFTTKLLGPRLNAFRAEIGLSDVSRVRHWWNSPTHVLLMFPDWYCPPQADWPAQAKQLGFPAASQFGAVADGLDPALEAFLDAGDPPVVASFSSARLRRGALERAVVEACLRIGSRCLVLTDEPLDPPASAEGRVHVARFAPLGVVLPRSAAIVHHGGVGTIATALAAGVPQLVAPFAFDQFDNAERVVRLGCGVAISRRFFTARKASRALGSLMGSPDIASACAQAAERSKARDATADAADHVGSIFVKLRQRRKRRLRQEKADALEAARAKLKTQVG